MLKTEIEAIASTMDTLGPTRQSGTIRSAWNATPSSVHNTYQIEMTEGQFAKTSGLARYDYTAAIVVARQWSQDTDFATSTGLLLDLLEQIEAALLPGAGSGAYQTISEYSVNTANYDEGVLLLIVEIALISS